MQTAANDAPRIRFISLFVPKLDDAVRHYQTVLQVAPSTDSSRAPSVHPFSTRPPVVFVLGDVALALYQCDGRATHPGDVGLGLETFPKQFSERAATVGGRTFWGPERLPDGSSEMCVTMLPDRHFFEIVAPEPD